MDGGKCLVGVAAAIETEQLAVQGQIPLGWSFKARYYCQVREADCKSTARRCPRSQESGH